MKTNMQKKVLMVNLLKRLENVDFSKDQGICKQVLDVNNTNDYCSCVAFLEKCFIRWPEYSGDIYYPVRVPSTFLFKIMHPFINTPEKAFRRLHCWKGEYGESRERLLTFIKEEVRVAINGGG